MATITEDYVTHEIARLLEKKGFDGECRNYIDGNSIYKDGYYVEKPITSNKLKPEETLLPTLQMAMKWLREVHKLHITILWDCGAYIGKNSFYYHIDRINNYEDKGYNKIGFDSNEEACEAAIKYCLENLI